MRTPPDRGAGAAEGDRATGDLSSGELFAVLWREVSGILGTAATAALVRRAARRAVVRFPELDGLSIDRENLEYVYAVPSSWNEHSSNPEEGLRDLTRELWTLLVELTGRVVVNRIGQIPELRGIVPRPVEEP